MPAPCLCEPVEFDGANLRSPNNLSTSFDRYVPDVRRRGIGRWSGKASGPCTILAGSARGPRNDAWQILLRVGWDRLQRYHTIDSRLTLERMARQPTIQDLFRCRRSDSPTSIEVRSKWLRIAVLIIVL